MPSSSMTRTFTHSVPQAKRYKLLVGRKTRPTGRWAWRCGASARQAITMRLAANTAWSQPQHHDSASTYSPSNAGRGLALFGVPIPPRASTPKQPPGFCCFETHPDYPKLLWMDIFLHHFETMENPFVSWHLQGNRIIPGFIFWWRETDFAHAQYLPPPGRTLEARAPRALDAAPGLHQGQPRAAAQGEELPVLQPRLTCPASKQKITWKNPTSFSKGNIN